LRKINGGCGPTSDVPVRVNDTGNGARPFAICLALALALSCLLSSLASAAEPPTITIASNPSASYTTAEVSGTVDTHGEEASVYVEYSSDPSEGFHFQYVQTIPAGTFGPTPISVLVTGPEPFVRNDEYGGLEPGTTYFFRLNAEVAGFGETHSPEPNPSATTMPVALPSATVAPATGVTGNTATLSGTVNPNAPEGRPASPEVEAGFATHWEMVCSPSCTGGLQELTGTVPAGNTGETVEVHPNDIEPGVTYTYQLHAFNAGGKVTSLAETFTAPPVAPAIEATYASVVRPSSATFQASVNPGGAPTTVHFQYVTQAQFAASGFAEAAETPEVELGSGNSPQAAAAPVSGLPSGTTYLYRAVAANVIETVTGPTKEILTSVSGAATSGGCPNEAFRTGPGALLPDCRAYEQATPIDKGGAFAGGLESLVVGSPDGDAITFYTQAGLPGGEGAQDFPSFLSHRSGGTWTAQGLLPAQGFGSVAGVVGYSGDLKYVVQQAFKVGQGLTVLLKDTETGTYETILPYDAEAERFENIGLAGVSDNDSLYFIESFLPLTGQAPPFQQNLYMWDRQSGTLSLVTELPGGGTAAEGSFAGPYEWVDGQRSSGGRLGGSLYVSAIHAISDSGDRVYFTSSGDDGLFLREGLTGPSPYTREISKSQKTNGEGPNGEDPEGTQPAAFLGASADGSDAFFMSASELTNDANTGSAGEGTADAGNDLYRYDAESEELMDLTVDPVGSGARVKGMLGSSKDGHSIYFVAEGILAQGAVDGANNLYHWEETASGPEITFVTALMGGEGESTEVELHGVNGPRDATDWIPGTILGARSGRTARVSADGQSLLFGSRRSITGYENESVGCDGGRGSRAPCNEFYRYSAASGAVRCVSCDPSGQSPLGFAELESPKNFAFFSPGDARGGEMRRGISANGNRVFFETPDALVPADTNGDAGCPFREEGSNYVGQCQDVYEWEAPGEGTCTASSNAFSKQDAGCLYLISTGTSSAPSYIADSDETGENVFFFTQSSLVPQDRDELVDIYDASEGGGLASQFQTGKEPCGSEASCQPSANVPVAAAPPATLTFNGSGNSKSKSCKANFRRKHGRCVKKPKRAKARKSKHRSGNRKKKGSHKNRSAKSSRGGDSQ
jgi:hypothetical protein